MRPIIKRALKAVALVVVVAGVGGAIFVKSKTSAFDDSMDKVYDVPPLALTASKDADVIARGKHLVESVGACVSRDCHGPDLAGGRTIEMGPVATLVAPNITPNGLGALYKDGELARLLRHGIKKDGRSIRFMPVQDFGWMSDADLTAMISYLRTVPGVDKPNGSTEIKTLGKVLDRKGALILDVARHIDHEKLDLAPPAASTAEYGKYLGRLCTGCHGEQLSGGAIPGAPSNLPIPLNITPDESGIKAWSYEDFDKLLTSGIRKNGQTINSFMPVTEFGKMNDTEKHALYLYLMSNPPRPFGGR